MKIKAAVQGQTLNRKSVPSTAWLDLALSHCSSFGTDRNSIDLFAAFSIDAGLFTTVTYIFYERRNFYCDNKNSSVCG
jgi:hypothetical protein